MAVENLSGLELRQRLSSNFNSRNSGNSLQIFSGPNSQQSTAKALTQQKRPPLFPNEVELIIEPVIRGDFDQLSLVGIAGDILAAVLNWNNLIIPAVDN